jgi:hypothetical protein
MVAVPPPANAALLLCAALLAICNARRTRRLQPDLTVDNALGHAPHVWVVLPLAALPVLGNVVFRWHEPLLWSLPVWLQYRLSGAHWAIAGATLAYVSAFAGTVAYATRHAERHKLVFVGVGFVAAVQLAQVWYTRPIAPLLGDKVVDGVVLQTHGSSCGAASAANVVRLLGGRATEKQMAELLNIGDGTSPAQVVVGLREMGVECRLASLADREPDRLAPATMLFVGHPATGRSSHAVTYAGKRGSELEIWDPLVGKKLLTRDELLGIWDGHAVHCKATAEFRRS